MAGGRGKELRLGQWRRKFSLSDEGGEEEAFVIRWHFLSIGRRLFMASEISLKRVHSHWRRGLCLGVVLCAPYMCVCVCVCVCIIHVLVCVCVCVYVYTYTYTFCVYLCICVCMYVHRYISIQTLTHPPTHTHTHTHTYTHTDPGHLRDGGLHWRGGLLRRADAQQPGASAQEQRSQGPRHRP